MNKYISDWWVDNLRKLPWEWIVNVLIETFLLVPWFSNFNFLQDYFFIIFIIITNLSRVLPAVIQPSGERESCHYVFYLSPAFLSCPLKKLWLTGRKFLQFSWAQCVLKSLLEIVNIVGALPLMGQGIAPLKRWGKGCASWSHCVQEEWEASWVQGDSRVTLRQRILNLPWGNFPVQIFSFTHVSQPRGLRNRPLAVTVSG